jgi:hypothetical protein
MVGFFVTIGLFFTLVPLLLFLSGERTNFVTLLFFLGGIVFLAYSASLSKKENTKKCPACAETIKIDAVKCRFCGEPLHERENPRV